MITKNEVHQIVNQVLTSPKNFDDSQSLFDTGILDSLKTMHLILLLEKKFDISLNQATLQMEDFESVDKLCAYLNKMAGENVL